MMSRPRIKKNIEYKEQMDDFSDEEIIEENSFEYKKEIIHFLGKILSYCFKIALFALNVSSIYLLWICLHYFSAHLYIKFCVPNTIVGFLMSPFMISTPHCQGLRWIVYNAAGIINNMWILIGAWIYSIIWIFNKDSNVEQSTF